MQAQGEFRKIVAIDAIVAVGANLAGDMPPKATVKAAMAAVAALSDGPARHSALYATPAFPPGAGPDFVNAALRISWAGTAQALLARLHGIEARMGRVRTDRWAARIIDLDLIALGPQVHPDRATQTRWADLPPEAAGRETPEALILPHPRLAERPFVLVPAAEVAPDWVHPVTGRGLAAMLADLPAAARAEVKRLTP